MDRKSVQIVIVSPISVFFVYLKHCFKVLEEFGEHKGLGGEVEVQKNVPRLQPFWPSDRRGSFVFRLGSVWREKGE